MKKLLALIFIQILFTACANQAQRSIASVDDNYRSISSVEDLDMNSEENDFKDEEEE